MTLSIFSDGGCVLKNPSPFGGTFCWLLVEDDRRVIAWDAGAVEPADFGLDALSNNLMELYAAVRGLEANLGVPVWVTDSRVTLCRLAGRKRVSADGVPDWLWKRAGAAWDGGTRPILCAGHPTREELRKGAAARNGLPVSRWNALADRLCREAAEKLKEKKKWTD